MDKCDYKRSVIKTLIHRIEILGLMSQNYAFGTWNAKPATVDFSEIEGEGEKVKFQNLDICLTEA